MNKKRIAIICSTDYKIYPMGGMMSFIVDILPYLSKCFDITLWGVSTHNESVTDVCLYGDNYPVKIFAKVKLTKKFVPNIIRAMLGIQLKVNQILSEGYDILYFHGIPLSYPFLNKSKENTPNIVNHIHGITNPFSVNKSRIVNNKYMIRMYDNYRKKVVRKSDLVLLAADKDGYSSFVNQFNQNISKKIHYIPNFADPQIFKLQNKKEIRKLMNLPLKRDILVNTGRLNIHKDPILLLKAFKYLKEKLNSNALLFLIGDGDLYHKIGQTIKEMNLSDSVKMLGRLERERIALWLNASDVYVYTSFGNGFPIALIEAAMCGLPIVSTDVQGVHDLVINGQTGYLVQGRDYKGIAVKIKRALENKNKLSENILELSRSYSIQNISKKIINLFQNIT